MCSDYIIINYNSVMYSLHPKYFFTAKRWRFIYRNEAKSVYFRSVIVIFFQLQVRRYHWTSLTIYRDQEFKKTINTTSPLSRIPKRTTYRGGVQLRFASRSNFNCGNLALCWPCDIIAHRTEHLLRFLLTLSRRTY